MYPSTSSCICQVGQYGCDYTDICWSSFLPPPYYMASPKIGSEISAFIRTIFWSLWAVCGR